MQGNTFIAKLVTFPSLRQKPTTPTQKPQLLALKANAGQEKSICTLKCFKLPPQTMMYLTGIAYDRPKESGLMISTFIFYK